MNVEKLYQEIFQICVEFAVYQKKDIVEQTEKILPSFVEFSEEFLKENKYGIEEEDYQLLKLLLIEILRDITQGIEQRDRVLLEDTVEYGVLSFLEMFFSEEQLRELKEGCRFE